MEIAYAEVYNIPVIMLYRKGNKISRFPRGIHNLIAEIEFCSYEDALTQLASALQDFLQRSLGKTKN